MATLMAAGPLTQALQCPSLKAQPLSSLKKASLAGRHQSVPGGSPLGASHHQRRAFPSTLGARASGKAEQNGENGQDSGSPENTPKIFRRVFLQSAGASAFALPLVASKPLSAFADVESITEAVVVEPEPYIVESAIVETPTEVIPESSSNLLEATSDEASLEETPASSSSAAEASSPAAAAEDACYPTPGFSGAPNEYQVQVDEINACAYRFPSALPFESPVAPLNLSLTATSASVPRATWILTRPPERYSSAAPLSPDARLRIVTERLFAARGVVLSVAICPPNDSFLSDVTTSKDTWTPIQVARSVLTDRTSPRMTTAQRLQETVVGTTSSTDICGVRYFRYEYLNARSPTTLTGPGMPEVFRHSVASTAEREGYLYTITASCLDNDWKVLGKELQACVDSFRLLPPTQNYVPPWKDPWRFW